MASAHTSVDLTPADRAARAARVLHDAADMIDDALRLARLLDRPDDAAGAADRHRPAQHGQVAA